MTEHWMDDVDRYIKIGSTLEHSASGDTTSGDVQPDTHAVTQSMRSHTTATAVGDAATNGISLVDLEGMTYRAGEQYKRQRLLETDETVHEVWAETGEGSAVRQETLEYASVDLQSRHLLQGTAELDDVSSTEMIVVKESNVQEKQMWERLSQFARETPSELITQRILQAQSLLETVNIEFVGSRRNNALCKAVAGMDTTKTMIKNICEIANGGTITNRSDVSSLFDNVNRLTSVDIEAWAFVDGLTGKPFLMMSSEDWMLTKQDNLSLTRQVEHISPERESKSAVREESSSEELEDEASDFIRRALLELNRMGWVNKGLIEL